MPMLPTYNDNLWILEFDRLQLCCSSTLTSQSCHIRICNIQQYHIHDTAEANVSITNEKGASDTYFHKYAMLLKNEFQGYRG